MNEFIGEWECIQHPQGFPYVLYQQGSRFTVAATEEQAHRRLGSIGELPKPVSVDELISTVGRSIANAIFRKYSEGKGWVMKDGHVFLKALNRSLSF
jgi:hypothetical protein